MWDCTWSCTDTGFRHGAWSGLWKAAVFLGVGRVQSVWWKSKETRTRRRLSEHERNSCHPGILLVQSRSLGKTHEALLREPVQVCYLNPTMALISTLEVISSGGKGMEVGQMHDTRLSELELIRFWYIGTASFRYNSEFINREVSSWFLAEWLSSSQGWSDTRVLECVWIASR